MSCPAPILFKLDAVYIYIKRIQGEMTAKKSKVYTWIWQAIFKAQILSHNSTNNKFIVRGGFET